MVEQVEPLESPFAPVTAGAADLSAEIAAQVEREPSDRVACRHVYADYYRCNWWAQADATGQDNPGMSGPTVSTHRVRKSAFLRATRTRDGITIRVV